MQTAIFGGTFNPIHNAHIYLLNDIRRQMNFDRIFVIPTNVPPHKENLGIASGEDRMNMCSLALSEYEIPCKVLDIELKRSGKSYTADTLKNLRALYPEDIFYLIMGEDMFITLDKWVRFNDIISQAQICAVIRSVGGKERMEEKKREYESLGAVCHLLNTQFTDISSTQIRNMIKRREDVSSFVPSSVLQYINNNKLYLE